LSPVVYFKLFGFEAIIARRAKPTMVPRTEIIIPRTALFNLLVKLLKLSPVFVKFVGVVFSPGSYGLCMAKLKRYTRPMSKADMDNPSITEERRDGKSVETELGTADILWITISSGLRIFIVFSCFEVVNP
jgi:hypothetical protein